MRISNSPVLPLAAAFLLASLSGCGSMGHETTKTTVSTTAVDGQVQSQTVTSETASVAADGSSSSSSSATTTTTPQ